MKKNWEGSEGMRWEDLEGFMRDRIRKNSGRVLNEFWEDLEGFMRDQVGKNLGRFSEDAGRISKDS